MKLSQFAAQALKWIGFALGLLKNPLIGPAVASAVGGEFAEKMPGYMKRLDKLERTVGAHTTVWSSTEAAYHNAKAQDFNATLPEGIDPEALSKLMENGFVVFGPDQIRYLYGFKREWDRMFKDPMKKLAEGVDLDGAADTFEDAAGDGG